MALVQLSVVEQRLDAVRAVLAGAHGERGRLVVRGVSPSQFMAGWLGIWLRVLRVLRIGRIGRTLRRSRPVARWRSGWRRCAVSIRGGVQSGSGWSC